MTILAITLALEVLLGFGTLIWLSEKPVKSKFDKRGKYKDDESFI